MKYRILSNEELRHLEKEFVHFLAVSGIDPPLWINIKENDTPRMLVLIEQFSEMVLEGALQRVQHIELRRPKSVQVIQCLPDKMVLAGLSIAPDSVINLTETSDLQDLIAEKTTTKANYFMSEKPYTQSREEDIFLMLETGFLITDAKLFEAFQRINQIK
ncbi:hypothetical protein SAMN05421780_103163 [Flexibacter flexilis DSM 6793]|uniref:Uncharacterized protein n=1 Tax=Flexibacter flexilis DSM 6793 TaxID=927664 RepID=A0A1I1H7U1_9BACT|nr:DUF6495 family protein [Flexibacter flexilis]SFC17503.1 hypothetical protein SAMN05421780_103163 [Flexibacter flexilis DSM 6793]